MPKSNSQQKSTPDARIRRQQVGAKGEERAALLRVRTGRKALRAVGGSFFKLWESKEKLTGRNTPPAVRKTKGLRNSREEPAHPRWRKEAAGRGKINNTHRLRA